MNDRTPRPEPATALRGAYHAATIDELRRNSSIRRVAALIDQRLLFPHRGRGELTPGRLTLGSWRSFAPGDVAHVSMQFLREYGRVAGGGARGGFPSFGVFGKLGAPLVLDLRTGERVVLLISYTWWAGTTKNAHWLPALKEFANGQP